ncbi:MAG: GNAT family N-acetyltransferase, partial [Betaproteobacteria bacterium]|nr:GNAT family N-acetyltransferase [Betaproteobacteria bacterium]
MNVEWQLERFDALQLRQLYELLQLRSAVFAVEQNCVYQDLDDLDFEAFHLLGCKQETGQLLAYARCLPAGLKYPEASIGRVVVSGLARGRGLGHELIRCAIAACGPCVDIRINAQAYLESFYLQHGFIAQGDVYLEDGIRHQMMLRPAC